MNEHTKLPWKITDGNRAGDVYVGNDDNTHMIIVTDLFFLGNAKDVAELIVRACNSYKKMLTACEISETCFRKLANISMLASSKDVLLDNANLIQATIKTAEKQND